MKKTISIVLLLALCLSLFAGCDLIPLPQQPPVEASNLERAKALVFNSYKPSKKDEVPAKSTDFEVMTGVLVDGEMFPVSWTVEVTSGPADAVKIVDSSEAFKKVDVTEKPTEEILFTLTATISDSEGNTETVSFNFKTPKFEAPTAGKVVIKNVADAKYATGTEYKYTSSSGSVKMELTLTENKANALAYTMIENADGTVSFKTDDGYFLSCDATNVEFVTAESDYTKFVLEVADGGYYIKCAVANYNGKAQYLEVYSGYLTCYGMGSNTDLYIFALEDATGANGKVQKEGTSTEPTQPTETTPTEPVTAQLPEVSAPVEGTAYKFGMIQVNTGNTVYITGEISTRYLVTTTDKAAAIDVYVEAAEGGYKFYILVDGAKNYIYIYNNDEGKRSVGYSATEANVFTYNAEISTWATTFDGKDCYVGGYNSFETLSVSDLTYINAGNAGITQFPAGFFSVEGGSTEPTTPSEPSTEPTTPAPSGSLVDGSKIVIVCGAYNKALSSLPATPGSYYQLGVDVVIADGTVTGYADTEVWTVIAHADGTYSFAMNGQNLGMQDSFSSMSLGAVNDKWELVPADNGTYLIKNTVRGNCIEWYASKGNWSTYTTNSTSDPLFTMSIFVIEGGSVQPPATEPTEPETQPTEPETQPTEPEVTEPVTSGYVKITTAEQFTSGTYVMIASHGVAPSQLSGTWVLTATPVVSGNAVTDTAGAVWTITVSDSGVILTDANGVSIAPKGGNSNGVKSGEYNWAWVLNDDGTFTFNGTGSDTVSLASNTGSDNKFRGYKTTTISGNPDAYPSTFTLYKLVEG